MHFEPPRPRSDEERILPLINIVFLLLIFFMLTGQLTASDPFDVAPPRSVSEGGAGAPEIVVLVGADGALALDGAVIDATSLGPAVAERMAADASTRVRLKADGQAEATQVISVMETLGEAGVERLSLLTVAADR